MTKTYQRLVWLWLGWMAVMPTAVDAKVGTEVGDDAPPVYLKSMDGMKVFDLASLKGKKSVFINIFNTWCGPCHAETPDLVKLYKEFKDKGVEVVSVCTPWNNDSVEKLKKYVDRYQMPWLTGFDADAKIAKAYETEAVPTNCLVGKDGKVLFYLAGGLNEPMMRKVFEAGASGKAPEIPGMPPRVRRPAAPSIKEGAPWVGVQVAQEAPTGDVAPEGLIVAKVIPGSPAEKAGLKQDDRIVKLAGQPVLQPDDFVKTVRAAKVGDVLQVIVLRNGATMTLSITIEGFSAAKMPGAKGAPTRKPEMRE